MPLMLTEARRDPAATIDALAARFKTFSAGTYHGPVGYAEITLLSGDVFTVEGTLEEVERKLSDAARSGQSRLAWFTEHGTDGRIGVNPAHVATLKISEIAD